MEDATDGAEEAPARVRQTSSLYDFVKVRVWLGDGEERHATVLSRFLLVRTLTAAKVPYDAAVKVALRVKKELVDADTLDVSQAQLEAVVFRVLRKRAFGDDYVSRYRMLSAWHVSVPRRALILLICGGVCTAKSTVASQLSQRLNLPNVLQTDVVHEVLRASQDAGGQASATAPLWASGVTDEQALLLRYREECSAVCKGMDSMLRKALSDGKALVIEGLHCHAAIFQARIRELFAELADPGKQPPVVVPICLLLSPSDRQMLLAAKRSHDPAAAATNDSTIAAVDSAMLASDAFAGALQVHFTPASDVLAMLHEHVLARVSECVTGT